MRSNYKPYTIAYINCFVETLKELLRISPHKKTPATAMSILYHTKETHRHVAAHSAQHRPNAGVAHGGQIGFV